MLFRSLSEVNEASSLIQTAAHEDANIIFGAVLDEKMGDDVKITVIATGFRDQMPARRARMLDVEAIPVVSVPVVAPDSWMKDSQPATALRFMSEAEEEEIESYVRPTAPPTPVPTPVPAPEPAHVTAAVAEAAPETQIDPEPPSLREYGSRFAQEPEAPSASARPRFAELAEPHAYAPPRDYASEHHPASSSAPVQAPHPVFGQPTEPGHEDLDIPAFLRRGQF